MIGSKIARAFAIVLHPLLMPLYATWLILNSGSYLSFATSPVLQKFIYLVVFISTTVFPGLGAWSLLKQGKIGSIEMPVREHRHWPFIVTLVCYIASVFLLLKLPIPRIFAFMVGGGLLSIIWAFIVNLKWKVSIHMMGIGGLMGLMVGFAQIYHVNMVLTLMLIAVLAGILGWARLKRNAHTPSQVYVGFLGGFLIEFVYIWFFVKDIIVVL